MYARPKILHGNSDEKVKDGEICRYRTRREESETTRVFEMKVERHPIDFSIDWKTK